MPSPRLPVTLSRPLAPALALFTGAVITEDSVARPARVARRHAERGRGARIAHVYGGAVKGYAAKLEPSELAAVKRDPAVAHVEPDQWGYVQQQTTPTGRRVSGERPSKADATLKRGTRNGQWRTCPLA